jgi:integrase/recombinase XerC
MATRFKRGSVWYVKHKNSAGKWENISCGREASATDAEAIRMNYSAQELNRRHKIKVREVKADLIEQLEIYRDQEVPRPGVRSMRPKGKKSIQRYQAIVNNFIEFCRERDLLTYADITPDRAKDFLESLIALERSASTITKHRQLCINFFDWSIKHGYCNEQPFEDTKNPKKEVKIPRYFSQEELKIIFKNATTPYTDIFRFLYLTGMRTGELCNAELAHFDEAKKELFVPPVEGNKTKDPKRCIVHLNDDAIKIIKRQAGYRSQFSTADSNKFIFVNNEGNKVDNANIYRALLVILKKCEIKDASPHTLRHTCASHLVIRGVSLYIVRDILRHASIRETEIYAHLSKEAVRGAIELLTVS